MIWLILNGSVIGGNLRKSPFGARRQRNLFRALLRRGSLKRAHMQVTRGRYRQSDNKAMLTIIVNYIVLW